MRDAIKELYEVKVEIEFTNTEQEFKEAEAKFIDHWSMWRDDGDQG